MAVRQGGDLMLGLVRELFPLCRSITGDGLRETLQRIQLRVPIELREIPTGTKVLDWEVPKEWNIRAARIERLDGTPVIDFADCNLHVVNYSGPVDAIVSRELLAEHVHTLPDRPEWIPYRTSYYTENWGFCLQSSIWEQMKDTQYRVFIDSSLETGALSYGEIMIPGRRTDEILLSVHCCHPSLANDNLSGIAVAVELIRALLGRTNELSYRFLFIPATIGSITWLALNESSLNRIKHGLVLTCVGDAGRFHYKRSRQGQAMVDRAVAQVLVRRGVDHLLLPFGPYGYDERQFCSPAFNLPVGCFMRSPNGTFPEYHTSADNPDFLHADALQESYSLINEVLELLDCADRRYARVDGRGEPQLGRRGLYRAVSGQGQVMVSQMALLWVLNLADGHHSLLDMAEVSGLGVRELMGAADLALAAELIR